VKNVAGVLTQQEADFLIAATKRFVDVDLIPLPGQGACLTLELAAIQTPETFRLDVSRSTIKVSKCTHQGRYRTTVLLLRLDVDGRPHTNPDGTTIECPHLHKYREGYDDKWAHAIDPKVFTNVQDLATTFREFAQLFGVVHIPAVQGGLF